MRGECHTNSLTKERIRGAVLLGIQRSNATGDREWDSPSLVEEKRRI